jgi:hypothetical protein
MSPAEQNSKQTRTNGPMFAGIFRVDLCRTEARSQEIADLRSEVPTGF